MAKINKSESARLMGLFEQPGWEVFMKVVALRLHEIESRPPTGGTDFEYLRSAFMKDGRAGELRELFYPGVDGQNGLEGYLSE